MPVLTKAELLEVVVSSIHRSGWRVLHLSDEHPFRLIVYREDESFRVRVYIWNLTHGGGMARPAHEFRVQITGVSHFEPEPSGKTLILGWWQDRAVFAGFDLRRHSGPLGRSPSIQIREEFLAAASTSRFAVCPKENQELAIAFGPDFLAEYIRNLDTLHGFGESQPDLDVLEAVAQDPRTVSDQVIEPMSGPRREAVYNVRRRLRAADFQSRVLNAYEHHCAFCGVQLQLVEAAHIVPVADPASTDETSNGIALCGLHHSAYDDALIAIDEHFHVMINQTRMRSIEESRLGAGREAFLRALRPVVILPRAALDQPRAEYVRTANRIRGWLSVEVGVPGNAS